MKELGLIGATEEIGNMAGDKCIEVFYSAATDRFYVMSCDESRTEIPEHAKLICAGQPDKFFGYLRSLLMRNYYEL